MMLTIITFIIGFIVGSITTLYFFGCLMRRNEAYAERISKEIDELHR